MAARSSAHYGDPGGMGEDRHGDDPRVLRAGRKDEGDRLRIHRALEAHRQKSSRSKSHSATRQCLRRDWPQPVYRQLVGAFSKRANHPRSIDLNRRCCLAPGPSNLQKCRARDDMALASGTQRLCTVRPGHALEFPPSTRVAQHRFPRGALIAGFKISELNRVFPSA
jgi:hypothetical protein